jgi:ParB family chromosome partitioning protein
MGHARALITATIPAALAEEVARRKLSVRETEKLAKMGSAQPARRAPRSRRGHRGAGAAAERAARGGRSVRHAGGSGALTLNYSTLDQLDMICQRLTGGAI